MDCHFLAPMAPNARAPSFGGARPWRSVSALDTAVRHLGDLAVAVGLAQFAPDATAVAVIGACLVMLCLGWPLALPTLCMVGAIAWLLSPGLSAGEALRLTVWHGIVPATLAMLWGAALRCWLGTRVFIYIFGCGFVGSVVSLFAAGMLSAALGHALPGVQEDLSTIARWLMAWGDAVVTGMMSAVFVAYKPQWLATWSDDLYLNQTNR